MKKAILLLSIIGFFYSCQIDENPNLNTEGNLLVKIEPDAFLATETSWVMVHDIDGNVLDFGRVNRGSQNFFDTKDENQVHITFARLGGGGGMMRFESITNVSASEEYAFGLVEKDHPNVSFYELNDPIEITLNHQEPVLNLILSNLGEYSPYMIPPHAATFKTLTSILSNSKSQKFLFPTMVTARSADNELRYIYPNPELIGKENQITFEFNEMSPFNHIFQLPVAGLEYFYYEVSALGVIHVPGEPFSYFKRNMVDIGNKILLKDGESFFPIGFPFMNENLFFNFWGKQVNGNYFGYQTFGNFPENLQLPKNETINVSNPSPENLIFSSSYDFDRFKATWIGSGEMDANGEGSHTLVWNLEGKTPGIKIVEIPLELQNIHPVLKNIGQLSVSLNLTKSTLTYEEFVKNKYIDFKNLLQEETTVGFPWPSN